MTIRGAHRFGAGVFAVGVHKIGPVEVIPPDGKDVRLLTSRFANGVPTHHGRTNDITYRAPKADSR